MSDTIQQNITFEAGPERVYDALTDGAAFGAITGAPATIDAIAGGAFSCFGGAIEGRNIELVRGKRIVQAWRVSGWPEGVFSVVRFDLAPRGSGAALSLHHAAFPDGAAEHLAAGWESNYWSALRKLA